MRIGLLTTRSGLDGYLEKVEGALLESGRDGDDIEGWGAGIFRLHTVGDDGGQVVEERLKTVHG